MDLVLQKMLSITDSSQRVNVNQKLMFAFIMLATLVGCRLWSFQGISDRVYDAFEVTISLVLITIVFFGLKKHHYQNGQFSLNVIFFIAFPLLSSIGAGLFHNQEFHLSILLYKTIYFWLLYFVLHIFNIPVKWVINLMIFIGVVWVVLTVGQQFTYPDFFFYTRDGEDGQLLRAGVYRYMLDPQFYGLFLTLYFYDKFLKSFNLKYIIIIAFGLLGIYYFGTRQYAVTAIICMVLSSVMQTGNRRMYSLLFIGFMAALLLILKDVLFASYIEMTKSQLSSEDDIRLLAAEFYFFDYWPHWITFFIGNGEGHYYNDYGNELRYYMESLGYYRSDIGIIGALNSFGLFHVLNIIYVNLKGISNKFYTQNTVFLKLFFVNLLLLLFLTDDYALARSIPFFCFIFYLVDKSYQQKKEMKKDRALSLNDDFSLSQKLN